MSNYLAVLNIPKNAENQWLHKLSNVTKSNHHMLSHFTTIKIMNEVYHVVFDGELYNEAELSMGYYVVVDEVIGSYPWLYIQINT